MEELGFPLWIRLTHFFNILFISLLFRSGIEIIGAHPMLYWNDHCTPGTEWLKFSRKQMPKDRLWTSEDEKVPYSSWIALPGHDNLGMGRYWHFLTVIGWILTGLLYIVLLFATPQWGRLIPTSRDIFPQAWEALLTYLQFQIPPETGAFNALQQLVYAVVIFILAPLQILTGVAMSPAVAGRYPWYTRLFGGRQSARSLHFIGLAAFGAFTVVHVGAVVAHGLGPELSKIVLGVAHGATPAEQRSAIILFVLGLAVISAIHIRATRISLRSPRKVQHAIQRVVDPLRHALFHRLKSVQHYDRAEISPFLRPNGRPPKDEHYLSLRTATSRGGTWRSAGLCARRSGSASKNFEGCQKKVRSPSMCAFKGGPRSQSGVVCRFTPCLRSAVPSQRPGTSCSKPLTTNGKSGGTAISTARSTSNLLATPKPSWLMS